MFELSTVSKNLSDNKLITYSILLTGQDPIPNYLIGDSAYPLTPYSMKENTRAVLVTLKLSSIIYYEAQGIKLNVHLED